MKLTCHGVTVSFKNTIVATHEVELHRDPVQVLSTALANGVKHETATVDGL